MNENEAILTAAFGDDWEMYLISEGVVGGTEDAYVLADRVRVYELAEKVEGKLSGIDLNPARVRDAWFELWNMNEHERAAEAGMTWAMPDDDVGDP